MKSDLVSQVSTLDARKQKLLELLLRQQGVELGPTPLPRQEGVRFPLSPAQRRLWFLAQLDPDSAAYNVFTVVDVKGDLDGAVLGRALGRLIARHESLHTTFHLDGDEPVQRIHIDPPGGAARVPLRRVELMGLSPAVAAREAERLVRREIGTPFDLTTGPLFRALLLRREPGHSTLVLNLHHIVCDAWSLDILFQELTAFYEKGDGEAAEPPPLPVQYADFAVWQRRWLGSEPAQASLDFWRRRLEEAPRLALPTDRPRPPVQSARGERLTFPLEPSLFRGLEALARGEGVTPFAVLLAAFYALLHHWTGQRDLVLGTPVANRERAEVEGVVGFFLNTVTLRARLEPDGGFRRLVRAVGAGMEEALEHAQLPFEQLVEALQPERDRSLSPLFQCLFVLQPPLRAVRLRDLRLEPVPVANATTKLDLTLSLWGGEQGAGGVLEYRPDLWDRTTMKRLAAAFRRLLAGVAAAPDTPTAGLPVLSAAETHQLLWEWNDTATDLPTEATVWAWIEERSVRTPRAPALRFGERRLSYEEFAHATAVLAQRLREQGVGPEMRVGVALERSLELVIALHAVVRAGAAYVPLDPQQPAERRLGLAADAGLEIVLTAAGEEGGRTLEEAGLRPLAVDAEALLAAPPVAPPRRYPDPDPRSLAYVLYTSGSTGKPKGVMIRHRSMLNRLCWMQRRYPIREGDRVLQKTPFTFDVSVWEFFCPFLCGAELVVAPPGVHREPAALLRLVQKAEVTVMHFVPSLLQVWLEEPGVEEARCLRWVFTSGEALPTATVDRFFRRLPGVALENLYGPTEAAIEVTRWSAVPGAAEVPIGRAIDNTQIHILDRQGRPAPMGVVGELYIGGVQLARGYLGDPRQTAEKFVPDSQGRGTRLYRTGDRARYRADGEVLFLGRLDHQVKVRGFRIEPGEIEAVLGRHPRVVEAAVLPHWGSAGEATLVAYAVLRDDAEETSREVLQQHLRRHLPDYMVPPHILFLERMPTTASGKLDRRRLPTPEGPIDDRPTYVAPRNAIEERVTAWMAELLDVERVGLDDDFFHLGGHSLLAARLVARVRRELGMELAVATIFDHPTPAALAARLMDAARDSDRPPLKPDPARGGEAPLSFAQQRLWFLHWVDPAGPLYNLPAVVALEGPLDIQALRRALAALVARHEILRTVFPVVRDGEPRQRVLPPSAAAVPLRRIDLETVASGAEDAATAILAAEVRRPFDLDRRIPVRVLLLRLGPHRHGLVLTVHHIATDGWSQDILVDEWIRLYRAAVRGRDLDGALPPLPVQYADYALWQRRWLQGEAVERRLDYWRQRLANAPPVLDLPTDRPLPAVRSVAGATLRRRLPKRLTDSLTALTQDRGASLFMVLLAAYKTLLHRYTGQEDLLVGTPVAGRDAVEVEGLVGCFINTLVLRSQVSGETPFHALLAAVKESVLGAFTHADLPFERLVEALQPERARSHTPLFQVMMVLNNQGNTATATADGERAVEVGGLTLRPLNPPGGTAKFELSLVFTQSDDALSAAWLYRTDRFDGTTVARMAGHFQALLEGLVAAPETPLEALPLLTPAERHQTQVEWNAPTVVYPAVRTVHEHFEEQARCHPQATALILEGERCTYRDLNVAANRLARALRRRGIGPDGRVAVCAERSFAMVTALLAVLKAGGAYVPLDPTYPTERLAMMLEDSAATVLLTSAALGAALPPFDGTVIDLDRLAEIIGAEAEDDLGVAVATDNLAYIIFTSGSTGRPKGVMIPHRGVCHRLLFAQGAGQIQRAERFLHKASISFDVSVLELFIPLLAGAASVLMPADWRGDPAALVAVMAGQEVTQIIVPPSLLHALLEERLEPCRALRTVVSSAETLPVELRQRFFAHGDRLLFNRYGPTETSIAVSSWLCRPGQDPGTVPIGRPVAGARLYAVDRRLRPLPMGLVGELAVAGPNLGRGYLGRPGATAAVFVPDPFGTDPAGGGRLYRTGDRVRFRPDGALEFLGRLDHQVKIRGFRIEIREIEETLQKHPTVARAVVELRRDLPGGEGLAAYIVPAADGSEPLNPSALRPWLAERLPEYMVPAACIPLAALPLGANGKVDRKALPVPRQEHLAVASSFVAPRTPVEEILCAVWSEVLGVERIGVHDDFFELGGHSLLATRILARVRAAFECEVPLQLLFEAPTVAGLAGRLAAGRDGERIPVAGPRPRAVVEGATVADGDAAPPLSFAQQRLWFLDQLDPGNPAYNMPLAVALTGTLDAVALATALGRIEARHEVLRSCFPTVAGKAVVRMVAAAPFPLPVVDLGALPEAAARNEARALRRAFALRPFALAEGPLWRACLLRHRLRHHEALLNMHHIVSDGWSMGLLMGELATLYGAATGGGDATLPELPELPVQYGDFAAWQREWLSGAERERQLRYWSEHLAGMPETLALPLDRPRPAVQRSRGGLVMRALPSRVAGAVKAFSRRHGVTPFMALLATFSLLLRRLSQQRDFGVSVPVANRGRVELEPLLGFFVNTLVLRMDDDHRGGEEIVFGTFLAGVRRAVLDAHAHQDLPFELLVSELQLERDLSRAPLAQVMFDLQVEARRTVVLPDLTLAPLESAEGTAKLDLSLTVALLEDGLRLSLEFDRDLFDTTTVTRWLESFRRLVQTMTGEKGVESIPLGAFPLLSAAEGHQLAVEWSGVGIALRRAAPGAPRTLPDRVAAHAAARPHAPAVVASGVTLSYRQVDERANDLARRLRHHGVEAGDRIAVFLDKSPELVPAVLGVLRAGAAYVPVDTTYAVERVGWLLEDARPRLVITREEFLTALPGGPPAGNAEVLCLDAAPGEAVPSPALPLPPSNPEATAYVVYTSGSTGRPKGVEVSHRNLDHACRGWLERYGLAQHPGRHLQMASFSFDVWSGDLARALGSGGTLVLCPRDTLLSPSALMELLRGERIDCAEFVPAVARYLADHLEAQGGDLSRLRLWIIGSDSWNGAEYRRMAALAGPHTRLINSYGVSEATIDSSYFAGPTVPSAEMPVPIGRPFPGTTLHAVDRDLRPCTIGVAGELVIGGDGVTRGYLGRPRLTADRFVADPFTDRPGARLYRTGDRARFLASGDLELLGRLDQQVKIRGHRVELGEVEAVLVSHPAVRAAAATLRGTGNQVRLVTYAVLQEGSSVAAGELRGFLAERLPDYMIPAHCGILETLPLTPNGKVDRRALPEPPAVDRGDGETPRVAPRNAIEVALARCWSEVLGVDTVGVHDNFFQLGGDSIISIQVISRALEAGWRLTPSQIFQHRTIAELALVAEAATGTTAEQGPVTGEAPLTPIQEWFFEQDFPEPHHWNQAVMLRVVAAPSPTAVAAAVAELYRHHDALRLRIRWTADGPRQVFSPPTAVPFAHADLGALPLARQEGALQALMACCQGSLGLEAGPLLRALWIDLGPDRRSRLLLVVHHLAVDAVSWRVLLEDLQRLVVQPTAGLQSRLPAKTLPAKTMAYRDWAERLERLAGMPSVAAEIDSWITPEREAIRPLPVDGERGRYPIAQSKTVTVCLEPEATEKLIKVVPEVYQSQVQEALLTALARTLNHWSGRPTQLVMVESHGRGELFEDADVSRTVGWFTVEYPLLLDLRGAHDPGAALVAVKEQLRRVPGGGMGYGLLRYRSPDPHVRQRLRGLPPAEVSFNYHGRTDGMSAPGGDFEAAPEGSGPAYGPRNHRTSLLAITGSLQGGRLTVSWLYSPAAHRRATVERLAGQFLEEVRALIVHCTAKEGSHLSPTDFAEVDLDQEQLDAILTQFG